MVKIAKDGVINIVPMSAFNNYFKSFGWEIVGENYTPPIPVIEDNSPAEPIPEKVEDAEQDSDEWDEVLDELKDEEAEKPLSEMNKEELLAKAKSMNIDVSKANTNKQLREVIKSYM